MVILQKTPPDILLGFVTTSTLSNTAIDQVEADFRRGAFDAYEPLVKLSLDRSRFLGSSPEQVRSTLDAAGTREAVVIIDVETEESQSLLWIDSWLDEALSEASERDEWVRENTANVPEGQRILLKLRIKTIEVPDFHLRMSTGNTDIFMNLPFPYDLQSPQTCLPTYDWDTNPPEPHPPYIIASPEEIERSSDPQHTSGFLMPNGSGPKEVIRLKEELARQNGLRSVWTADSIPSSSREEGMPEGSLKFSQKWDTERMAGSE